jgi:hypothetical protein
MARAFSFYLSSSNFLFTKSGVVFFFQLKKILISSESWLKKTQTFSENTSFASFSKKTFLKIAKMHPRKQKKGY